jgi:hypothetical protein
VVSAGQELFRQPRPPGASAWPSRLWPSRLWPAESAVAESAAAESAAAESAAAQVHGRVGCPWPSGLPRIGFPVGFPESASNGWYDTICRGGDSHAVARSFSTAAL